jgi:transcriptional regulator of acetoin/glycerol metabolism
MEQTGRALRPTANRVALRSQWEAFQDRGTIATGVRPEVAASWRRSAASRLGSALMAAPLDQAALRGFESR